MTESPWTSLCDEQDDRPRPTVSFVTVAYRDPDAIRLLLRGMESAQCAFSSEYFLVNNAPDDPTSVQVRERFPWVTVLDASENLGFGAGNNLALRRIRGTYVILLNPDIVVLPGELEKLVAFMDEHPDIGIAGPGVLNPDRSWQDSCYRFPTFSFPLYRRTFLGRTPWGKRAESAYVMRDILTRDRAVEADVLMGSVLCIRRSALEDVGLFDDRFFMYMEDFDLCRRMWKKNWRVVYVPSARVIHYHRRESRISWPWQLLTHKLTRTHIRSAVYYFWKYRGESVPHSYPRSID